METKIIRVRLEGLRPLMFDRYAGDNNTQLPVQDKMYLSEGGRLIMPAINLFSLLVAENTKSVCRQFFGKAGKTIALGIGGYVNIEPFEIPILGVEDAPVVWSGDFNEQIIKHASVARVKNGIPNPKVRPMLTLPWALEFDAKYVENKYCTFDNLRQAFDMGGSLGLGTFRPFFGRYQLTKFEEQE